MSIITKKSIIATALALSCSGALAQQAGADAKIAASGEAAAHLQFGFGTDITDADLQRFVSPLPDGRGLPKGSGTVMQGEKVYMQQCLACHGAKLEGGLGDRLVGGRGSLVADGNGGPPVKTVESYWPYATTLFDYINRAMPFMMPNSMSHDEVYAVTAYILAQANIIPDDATLDQKTLPQVVMPNQKGFKPADR
ncbi:cytochrome C [Pollutimonas nitritireducens]|uniref:Cytochrome C n=1 Tax=Pollutimonas nitritireducens TaxID=2045209 RepID=A0A2N4UE89_9BURK|nr:cytochrome c [Pollutimonas nitritireducens]PLC53328.1 cytochrome C [Pollutimonas nitritireducens]